MLKNVYVSRCPEQNKESESNGFILFNNFFFYSTMRLYDMWSLLWIITVGATIFLYFYHHLAAPGFWAPPGGTTPPELALLDEPGGSVPGKNWLDPGPKKPFALATAAAAAAAAAAANWNGLLGFGLVPGLRVGWVLSVWVDEEEDEPPGEEEDEETHGFPSRTSTGTATRRGGGGGG